MKVLVAHASKHGSTAEIAERIADTLRGTGREVEVLPFSRVPALTDCDAVVLGSAVYMGHWMKEAAAFVRQHQSELAQRPVWLFSSGPVGPKQLPEPVEIARFRESLEIRDHRVFAGALDASKLSLAERLTIKAVKAPYGDFRPWDDIDGWGAAIARSLDATSERELSGVAGATPAPV